MNLLGISRYKREFRFAIHRIVLTYDVYITTELMARYKQETQELGKKVQEFQVR